MPSLDLLMGPVGLWILFIAFCLWAALAIKKEASTYLIFAQTISPLDDEWKIKIPRWWKWEKKSESSQNLLRELNLDLAATRQFVAYDPEGEGLLLGLQFSTSESNLKSQLRGIWEHSKFEPDEVDIEEISHPLGTMLESESRATMISGEEAERVFLRLNLIPYEGGHWLFLYRCGVLAGLVDGYFMRQTLLSLNHTPILDSDPAPMLKETP